MALITDSGTKEGPGSMQSLFMGVWHLLHPNISFFGSESVGGLEQAILMGLDLGAVCVGNNPITGQGPTKNRRIDRSGTLV